MDPVSDEEDLEDLEEIDIDGDIETSLPSWTHNVILHNGKPIYCIAAHPINPSIVATGGEDDRGLLLRISGERVETIAALEGHTDTVSCIGFSFDGKLVATGSLDGSVGIWDGCTGTPKGLLTGPDEVAWIDWHPTSHILVAGSADGLVWQWNASTGDCIHAAKSCLATSICGKITPDGRKIVATDKGKTAVLDLATGKTLLAYTPASAGSAFPDTEICSLAIHPNSNLAAVGSADGKIRLLDLKTCVVRASIDLHEDAVEALHFTQRLPILVSAGLDGRLHTIDSNTFQVRSTCSGPEGYTVVKLVNNDELMLAGSLAGEVAVWDVRGGYKTDCVLHEGVTCYDLVHLSHHNLVLSVWDDGRLLSFPLLFSAS